MLALAKSKIPLIFLNYMFTPDFRDKVIRYGSNMRDYMERVGLNGTYKYSTHFASFDIDAYSGLLFANGLSPRTQVEMWFQTLENSKIFCNNFSEIVSQMGPEGGYIFAHFLTLYESHTQTSTTIDKKPLFRA